MAASALSGAADAQSIELGDAPVRIPVQVHGFVSQGFIKSTGKNYLAATKRAQGSFEFTEVRINFSVQPTERLRIGMQLFARALGPMGSYNAKMDWVKAQTSNPAVVPLRGMPNIREMVQIGWSCW